MDQILREFRTGVRSLRRSAGFATVVVITLALGIGANTAIFSVVNAILLSPLPYRQPDRLVMFWETFPELGQGYAPITEGQFVDYQRRNQSLESMSGFRIRSLDNNRPVTLIGDGSPPLALNAVTCSSNLFDTLGVKPLIGRAFVEAEGRPGAAAAAIVSHGFWQRHLGGDPRIVGKSVILDGVATEIVGVLPSDFFFPPPLRVMGGVRQGVADVFLPYVFQPERRRVRTIRTVARLGEGVSLERAKADLDALATQLVEEFKDDNPQGQSIVLLPVHDQAVAESRTVLLLLMCAVGLILLIACVNVANLFLARGLGRRREMAIRVALGAGKRDILRQLLVESLLLALGGGLLGLLLAAFSLKGLVAVTATHVPQLGPVTINTDVLLFTLAVSLLTGLVFGIAPSRESFRPNLNDDLKEGERGTSTGPGREFFRKVLVVSEVSLAVILLVGAGLLLRSLWQLQRTDLGFDPQQVVAVNALPPETKYPRPEQIVAFFERLMTELETLPGVEKAAAVSQLPLSGGMLGGSFEIVGRDSFKPEEAEALKASYRIISEGYLETLRIPLLAGRSFTGADRADSLPVALIDRTLAQRLWPDGSWSWQQIRAFGPEAITIVGVVDAIRNENLRSENEGVIYFPFRQKPNRGMNLAVRTTLAPEALVASVRERLRRLDPEIAVRVQSMESYIVRAQSGLRSPALLFGCFAGLAVLLATIGLYGLMSFLVGQRRREIGIRLALGAERSQIIRKLALQAVQFISVGVVVGLAAAFLLSRLLTDLLYGVAATDPLTYAAVAFLFIALAFLSGYLPARRASRVNPIEALRTE